jgi:integrase
MIKGTTDETTHRRESRTPKDLDRVQPRERVVSLLPAPLRQRHYARLSDPLPSTPGNWRQEHYGARIFAPAVRDAGLPAGTTSHDLRHHFASVMLQATGNPVLVAEMLGHENAALVIKVYGHLMPGSEDQMRRVIDAAWSEDRSKNRSRVTGDARNPSKIRDAGKVAGVGFEPT